MFPLSNAFLLDLVRQPEFCALRQRIGIAFDSVTTSTFLAIGGPFAAFWWPTYLWTTFGQGMRFGVRALLEAAAASALGFAVVIVSCPYWQERLVFATSVVFALLAVPAYASILVSRLHAATADAESANRAKSRFLAFITHELRSPLNGIIGFSEMIRDQVLGPVGDDRYREWASDINDGGKHLLALINDLLDLSKAEAGKLEMNEDVIDLAELIASCFRLVGPIASKYKVALTCDLDPKAEIMLRADPLRMRQILINLLSNAVKFSKSGGNVKVRVTDLEAEGTAIAVSDTGIGMRPEDIPRALEPYGQVDASLTRRYEGTGLGLPLVKMLVEAHGGSLQIESAPDNGTTVVVRLPSERRVVPAGR